MTKRAWVSSGGAPGMAWETGSIERSFDGGVDGGGPDLRVGSSATGAQFALGRTPAEIWN